jgi:3-methyladenine DNA glycosylase AlkD
MNRYHQDILTRIKQQSGKPTQHTFQDSYLGNTHPRYPINAPKLRVIAKAWVRDHRISTKELASLLTSLIKGESSTEKCMAGLLLDYTKFKEHALRPTLFFGWLDHLVGWAEVDTLCTGRYVGQALPLQWTAWKKIIAQCSRSKNINKRRASLVLFCSPLRSPTDERVADEVFRIVELRKHEKDVLITKAISWVLRTLEKHHRKKLEAYLKENKDSLPAIAVRETMAKLRTGVKNKRQPAT